MRTIEIPSLTLIEYQKGPALYRILKFLTQKYLKTERKMLESPYFSHHHTDSSFHGACENYQALN